MAMPPLQPDQEVPPGLTWDEEQRFLKQRYILQEQTGYFRGGTGPEPSTTTSATDIVGSLALALLIAPFVLIVMAVFVIGEWTSHHAGPFRTALETLLPRSWVATAPGQPHNSAATAAVVGGVVVVLIVGTSLARRAAQRRWLAERESNDWVLFSWLLLFSTVRTLLVVGGLVAALTANGIASAADLENPSDAHLAGAWRWWASGLGIGLWSLYFTFRAYGRVAAVREAS